MKIAFNPSTVAALTTPPNNKDITFDLRGRNIFARGVKFCGTDTWRDIKINNVSIGSNILDLRNGSNTTLTNTNGVVTINSTWRPVVDNLTSDSTTSSLSANQGRVLAGLINTLSTNISNQYALRDGSNATGRWRGGLACFDVRDTNYTPHDLNMGLELLFLRNNTNNLKDGGEYNGVFSFRQWSSGSDWSGGKAHQLSFTDNGNIWHRTSSGDDSWGAWKKLVYSTDIPSSLKNPHALTISLNGTSQGPYDGSAAKNINITPGSIGAATSGHNHDSYYVKYGKVVKSTADNTNATPYLYNVEKEEVISGYYKYWYIFNMGQYSGGNFGTQIAMPYQDSLADSELFIRSAKSGSWRTWRRILHSNNYTAYTVTKNGTGANGTWGISITGNADTVDGVHVNQLCRIYTFNVHNSIIKVGTLTSGQYGHVCKLRFNSGIGYNAGNQDKTMTVVIRASNGGANSNGFYFEAHSESYRSGEFTTFYLHQTSKTQCELYMSAFSYSGQSTYEVSFSAGDSWTNEISVQNALPTSNIFTLPNYQIAYTDYNVASATKLATARTIWGQSFDGTGNISGTLSGVAHIQFSADNTYNIGSNSAASKYIYTYWLGAKSGQKLELGANNSGYGQGLCIDTNLNVGIGTNTPTYKLHVNGTFRATNSTVSDLFVNTGDATLKIYTGITTDAQNDGNICFQTSIDAKDGQSHAYPTQYQSRCNIVLQPRGGQVYIGTNPGTGNTTYKLYVNSKIFSNGGFVKNGSSDSYVLLGGGGHKAVSDFATASSLNNYVTTNTAQTISGVKTFSTQQKFTVGNGTAPFTVSSNTLVTNLNADLLDGVHLIKSGSGTGIKQVYYFSTQGNNSSYIKLGTLPSVSATGYGSSKVMFTVKGGINFGGTNESVYEVAASTRGSIQVTSTLVRGNRGLKFGYVSTSSNVEIWMAYDGIYRGATEVEVSSSISFTLAMTETTTKPSGFVEGSYRILAATTDNVASATKLATARTIWGQSFDGTADVSGFMKNVTGLVHGNNIGDDWSDGNNTHPWYGIDYRHCVDSAETGKAYTSISSYFGLYFKTGVGYRFIFDGGNVGIGTTSPTYKLDVKGDIRATGNSYATHFYESSDKTLKKNIKSILSSTNIPKIREFDWKDTEEHSYGFIAQELEEQGYGCLVSEANGKKTVNYTATLALTVAKLQNLINIQNKKISNLTKELKALKYGRKKNS